jgi:general secretion pathway protein H
MPISSAERGFSLIEIVMTVAILAMAVGIAGVALRPASQATLLASETREVASWLERTRHAALTGARSVTAIIAAPETALSDPTARIKLLRSPVRLGGTEASAVTYHADGSAETSRIVLTLADRQSVIEVDGLTGRIRITDRADAR